MHFIWQPCSGLCCVGVSVVVTQLWLLLAQRRPLCCVGASVVVTQVWLLLAQRRLSPGVLSVPSSAQDAPTENVPAQICAVLAEQRLTARHHFPLLTCLPLLSWSRGSRQSDLGWWGTGVLCSLAGPEGMAQGHWHR